MCGFPLENILNFISAFKNHVLNWLWDQIHAVKLNSSLKILSYAWLFLCHLKIKFWVILSESFYWLSIIQAGCRGKKTTTHYMWLDTGPGRSQSKGPVKGGTSSDTAFRFQAAHNLTNYLISVLYSTHFDYVFFFMSSKLLPVSAFWSLSCHFLYFIERWRFLWSCLCNSPSSERWILGVVELLLNYFMTTRKSCCVMSSLKFPGLISFLLPLKTELSSIQNEN